MVEAGEKRAVEERVSPAVFIKGAQRTEGRNGGKLPCVVAVGHVLIEEELVEAFEDLTAASVRDFRRPEERVGVGDEAEGRGACEALRPAGSGGRGVEMVETGAVAREVSADVEGGVSGAGNPVNRGGAVADTNRVRRGGDDPGQPDAARERVDVVTFIDREVNVFEKGSLMAAKKETGGVDSRTKSLGSSLGRSIGHLIANDANMGHDLMQMDLEMGLLNNTDNVTENREEVVA